MKVIISDTSPLILLTKVGLLNLIAERFSLVISKDVALEATCRQDLPDAQSIQVLIDKKKISVKVISESKTLGLKNQWGIGRGEASVLALALKENRVLVTDDFSAMRVARALNISFVTSVLLIVQLQHKGILSFQVADEKLMALQEYAWLSSEVVADARQRLKGGK
ncbi:MAG: hypothetical protein ACKVQC_05560 [Elusimicrobiota bacterium]